MHQVRARNKVRQSNQWIRLKCLEQVQCAHFWSVGVNRTNQVDIRIFSLGQLCCCPTVTDN